MNKTTLLIFLILTWILTACSANAVAPGSNSQSADPNGTASAGELSTPLQVAIGTIKLDGTKNAVTAEQARELLPLWETLQSLYSSDTAADREIQALVEQIQDAMTPDQMQAIAALNLTRQDMFSLMQPLANDSTGTTNQNSQGGTSSNNNRGDFGPGGGFQGGPPPDGGAFPGGGPGGQRQGSDTQSSSSTQNSTNRPAMDPNRIPTPLVQAVIGYLQQKSGA